jgi:hypothetical protein
MTAIQLRSQHLNNSGGGLNALTVEVYETDVNGLPTGAAVATTTTDANGVWKFLAVTGLLHSKRYAVKIINGSEVQWLSGADQAQLDELSVVTKLYLPNGSVVDSSGIPNAALAADVPRANLLTNGGFEVWQRGNGPFTVSGTYTADRWVIALNGTDALSVSRDAAHVEVGGDYYCAAVTYTKGNGGGSGLRQFLEQWPDLRGKTVSLSVRIRCATPDAVKVGIWDINNNWDWSSLHPGGDTWETLTVSHAVHATTNVLMVAVECVESCTCYVDSAMLVVGSMPADYMPLHPADEWNRCLRYYETIGGVQYGVPQMQMNAVASVTYSGAVYFRARKAGIPTLTKVGSAWDTSNCSQPLFGFPSLEGCMMSIPVTASGVAFARPSGPSDYLVVEANP